MKKIKIALVGQPNVGKSLLINALCKANMKVGNFSGVTIEKASAKTFYKNYEFCRRKNKISIWKNKTSIKVEILFFYKA